MKHQRLISSFRCSAVQEWLEEELENRGIDSVYARSILSLLQQDYVDVEPHECQPTRNNQLRVLYKYGGPENLCYAAKSKHQKWKTWGKHILTSASPCCKAAYYDLERILKKTAVDCLKSASDYVNDIEELIDEVWIKLKNITLKGEQEEIALRNHGPLGHSFFTPPSPTDEIEKYFAAFPPLSSKTVEAAEKKILKNAWCKNCFLKRKSKVQNEDALNDENENFPANKSMQPIIPYRSLKTIKNIFNKSSFKSPWKASFTQHSTMPKRHAPYKVKGFKDTAMVKDPVLSFKNLSLVNICNMSLDNMELMSLFKGTKVKNVIILSEGSIISQETLIAKSSAERKSNESALHIVQAEPSDLIPFRTMKFNAHETDSISLIQSFSEEDSQSDDKESSDYCGLDLHFKMSPLADLLEYKSPCQEFIHDISGSLHCNYLESLKHYYSKLSNSCDGYNSELCTEIDSETNSEPENPLIQKEKSFTNLQLDSHFVDEREMHSPAYSGGLEIKKNLYNQDEKFSINQSFNPLDTLETSHIEMNFFVPDSESDKHVESITSSNFESLSSDDEIYYSDDDSNEIFLSQNNEKFDFAEIPLQQTEQNSLLYKFSQDSLAKSEDNETNNHYNLIFSVNSDKKAILDRNEFSLEDKIENKLLLNLKSDNINFINVRSPVKEFPFIPCSQSEPLDKSCINEQKGNSEYFPKLLDERKSGVLIKPYSLAEPKDSNKISNSSLPKGGEADGQKYNEIYDKKWLFYWGDNDNFIARTWQKDFVPVEEKKSNEQLFYDSKISTALCQEIKEDGDELLKGLYSVPAICNTVFGNELCKPQQNDLHSSCLTSQVESIDEYYENQTSLYGCCTESNKISGDQVKNYNPVINSSLTVDNIENQVPEIQHSRGYSVSFENPFKAANFPDVSAFSIASEENGSYKDCYMEGGGWSLASDSFSDYVCDNPYEKSCSLSDLDLISNKYQHTLNLKRQRCISETDYVDTKNTEAPYVFKKTKRVVSRKRPCCFFLQGMCTRSDCRYSHDVSTTTCRFWKEGSCFKGLTCPFLHGYLEDNEALTFNENTSLRSQSPDLVYSLESEADFPTLASSKSEEPRVKSEAINIIYTKGSKKKRKEK